MFDCACSIANCTSTCQEDHVTTAMQTKTTKHMHCIFDSSAQLQVFFVNGRLIFGKQHEPVSDVHFSIYNGLFWECAMATLTVLEDLIISMAVPISQNIL